MNASSLIFLVIVGLVVVVQLLRWAVHKRRNKALGLPANAELGEKYDADRMPPPAVGDEPEPGHMTLRGGWQARPQDVNQPGRHGGYGGQRH